MPQTNRFDAGPVDIFYPLVKLASKNLTKKVVLVNTNNIIRFAMIVAPVIRYIREALGFLMNIINLDQFTNNEFLHTRTNDVL